MKVRTYSPGMGQAIADRTINRPGEGWRDVAQRVALGSHLLHPESGDQEALERHLAQASILLSGRHLQHGDASQPTRPGEVFTNCLEFNTLIPTLEYGVIKIGSIVGETVTIRTKDGEWRAAPVSSHGCQKLYQLTFGNPNRSGVSYEVAATRNHRWFLDDGALTDHIEIGDGLQFAPLHEDLDEEVIRHGIIFGDGSAPKYRQARPGCEVSQGCDYISIRLCKTKQEYLKYFNSYGVTYPRSASGRAPTFRLLLNGSGVGTCYDDDLQLVDLTKMPFVVPIINHNHEDVLNGAGHPLHGRTCCTLLL